MHNWVTRQIDYVLAFSQAPIDSNVFCKLPTGFQGQDKNKRYCLRLKKNLYGTKQAAANWFEMLRDNLIDLGFTQSTIDPCLFLRCDCILISYVDDCLVFSKDQKTIDELLIKLGQRFVLTDEGPDVSSYLGLKVEKDRGTITLSQPALITRILQGLSLDGDENTKVHDIPANKVLQKDEDGEERKATWNYRSIIGMMMYLASSTRPDTLFAVHQCAKYSVFPKRCHEEAVKRIGRYLKKTRTRGTIFRPNGSNKLDCYVDADFAGCFTQEMSHLKSSVLSRTGYIIYLSGCPIVCKSQMQSEIALSTTEAEYIALSQSLRDLIPLRSILTELGKIMNFKIDTPITHSTVFEDNNGALELAREPKYRPRTKHISIKYHHFREHVKEGKIKIEHVDTNEQRADIMTKPLEKSKFEYLRSLTLGW